MDVTAEHVVRIPASNLRVNRSQFAEVWARAEAVVDHSGVEDYFVLGVALTCEWLAALPVPSRIHKGTTELPRSPVSQRLAGATPELIEDEYVAAVRRRRSRVAWRAELARGPMATLEWAFRGNGRPPIDVAAAAG